MSFLARIMIYCWGIVALLCCLAIMLARTQPAPEFIPGLTQCQSGMCYLGIVPGDIRWDEARQVLSNTPEITFDPNTYSYHNLPNFSGSMSFVFAAYEQEAANPHVSEIWLTPDSASLNVGNAYIQWGQPCFAVPLINDDLGLIYPGMSLLADTHKWRDKLLLTPTTPLTQIDVFISLKSCDDLGGLGLAIHDWHGFGQYSPE